MDYAQEVARGAARLDFEQPGWAEQISLDRLAMDNCARCILGQVYGNYFDGRSFLFGNHPIDAMEMSHQHGFTLHEDERFPMEWAVLADAWRAEVLKRIEGGTQ